MISVGRLVINSQDPPCVGPQVRLTEPMFKSQLYRLYKARFCTVLPDFGKNILGGGGGAAFSVPQLTQAKRQPYHTAIWRINIQTERQDSCSLTHKVDQG